MIAGGVALLAVLLVVWFSWPSRNKDGGSTATGGPASHSTGTTPLEQQLGKSDPGVQLDASALPAPKVVSFGSSAGVVPPGQRTHLTWSVSGVSEVTITPDIGVVKAEGSVDIPLQKTTELVLVAKNEKGESVSSSVTVVVGQPNTTQPLAGKAADQVASTNPPGKVSAPSIPALPPMAHVKPGIVFEAFPGTIPPGGATMLRWNLTNAQSATIQPGPGAIQGAAGQLRIHPAGTTVYTLTSALTVQVQAPAQQAAQPPGQAPAPPANRPGFNIAVVIHDHSAVLVQTNVWPRCWGQLQVVGNHLQYRVLGTSDGRRDDFDVQLSQVQEATTNKMAIRGQMAFHVTIGGQHLNFIPQGTFPNQAVAAIQGAMHGQ
jgi:hypothetical protein